MKAIEAKIVVLGAQGNYHWNVVSSIFDFQILEMI